MCVLKFVLNQKNRISRTPSDARLEEKGELLDFFLTGLYEVENIVAFKYLNFTMVLAVFKNYDSG